MSFLTTSLRPFLARTARLSTVSPLSLLIPSSSSSTSLSSILPSFGFGGSVQTRNSTKRAGGSTKNNRSSAGRRLGVKRHTGQAVQIGHIILRQRGTTWHAGPNTQIGKDHTIFATQPGHVQFFYPRSEPVPLKTILPSSPIFTSSSSSSFSISPPIKNLSKTTYFAKELTVKPHPSSPKSIRRYIAVTLDPQQQFPLPRGEKRQRRFDKIDIETLKREIEEIKTEQDCIVDVLENGHHGY